MLDMLSPILAGVGLCLSFLLAAGVLLKVMGFLDGPEVRGKHHDWKKDEDPALASDASPIWSNLDKIQWIVMSRISRHIAPLLFPPPQLNFYDVNEHPGVEGLCAVTIDDCFCRQDDEKKSMIKDVKALLKKGNAKVTFFSTLKYSQGKWREKQISDLLKDGHELANHCEDDREYDNDSAASFEEGLLATDNWIKKMTGSKKTGKWFRAPSGKTSPAIMEVLEKHGMVNVMLDGYANDPHIPDSDFIAKTMLTAAQSGSILIIHFPEKGFREWNIGAMESLFEGLKEKGLKCVTLSELESAAKKKKK